MALKLEGPSHPCFAIEAVAALGYQPSSPLENIWEILELQQLSGSSFHSRPCAAAGFDINQAACSLQVAKGAGKILQDATWCC